MHFFVNSDLNKITWFKGTYTVSDNYITIDNSNIKSTSCIFVQISRQLNNSTTWEKVLGYPQYYTDGKCLVYLRSASDNVTFINGTVDVAVLILN